MVQERREPVCGVSGDSLGHPLLLHLYVPLGFVLFFFFSFPLVEKFNIEKSEGGCVCYSLGWVSLWGESSGWRSSLGNLLGKAVASELYLIYSNKAKSRICCYMSSS